MLKAQATETTKIDKLDFIKIFKKQLFYIKRHYQQSEKATHTMREMFENVKSDKSLIPRKYKELITTQQEKDKHPNLKTCRGLE